MEAPKSGPHVSCAHSRFVSWVKNDKLGVSTPFMISDQKVCLFPKWNFNIFLMGLAANTTLINVLDKKKPEPCWAT